MRSAPQSTLSLAIVCMRATSCSDSSDNAPRGANLPFSYLPPLAPLVPDDPYDLPPALVQTAGFDPLRDEGEAYAERLREAGVETTLTRYEGLIHGYFAMGSVSPAAQSAVDEAVEALSKALA